MYNLTVELLFNKSDRSHLNRKDLIKFFDTLCKRFTYNSNRVNMEFGSSLEEIKEINFTISNNLIVLSIGCDTYEDISKVAQGIFRSNIIKYKDYSFEVMLLDFKVYEDDEEMERALA